MAETGGIQIARAKTALDLATIIGLIAGFGLVIAAIVVGGTPEAFINIPSVLIVIGGTFSVTTMCFSLQEMMRSIKVVMKTISHTSRDSSEAAIQVLKIAELARRQGVLSLQGVTEQLKSEPL